MAQTISRPDTATAPVVASRANAVRDAILDLILQGKLTPGQETSEDQICGLLQAPGYPQPSRTPVRLALAVLEAQGFVIKRPQVGCLVVPVEPDEVEEITNLRIGVEQRVFGSLASHEPDPETTIVPRSVSEASTTTADHVPDDAFLVKERDFHVFAAQKANFATGASTIRLWGDRLRVFNVGYKLQNGVPALSRDTWHKLDEEHVQLEAAVAQGNPSLAVDRVTSHLLRFQDALLAG